MAWGAGGRCGGGGVDPILRACYLRVVPATTAWRWPSEWRCGTAGLLSQAFVRSVGRGLLLRSVLASLAVLSGRTRRPAVLEHGSSAVCLCRLRRRWTMPHGAVVAWRRAPALEPRSSCHVSWGRIWAKTDLAEFCPKRNQARKNKRVPLMRFHVGFVVGKIPQHNELSRLPQSSFMSVGGGAYTFGHGP